MKKIKSRYKLKKIDNHNFMKISINGEKNNKPVVTNNPDKQGLIYMPYVCVENINPKPDQVYEKFMKQYDNKHELCPKCGSKEHISTLMGYLFDRNNKDDYKDLNTCNCLNCGDVHTFHERISISEFNKKIIGNTITDTINYEIIKSIKSGKKSKCLIPFKNKKK